MGAITSNAKALAAVYAARRAMLDKASRDGMKKAAAAVDRQQVLNLSGSGDPGVYPVPRRTGDLARGHFFNVINATRAVVGNTSGHAAPIHEGRGSSSKYGRRPYLDNAVEQGDPGEIYAAHVSEAIRAI